MKKLIPVLLILLFFSVLCSCSSKGLQDEDTKSTSKSTTEYKETDMKETIEAEKTAKSITIRIGEKSFSAQLYDNETAQTFADMLPITLDMQELHGNEKYYYMSETLPTDSSSVGKINTGDIMLYGDNCIVMFYDSFSTPYSYTKIGHIDNPSELAEAVGDGNVTVEYQLNY